MAAEKGNAASQYWPGHVAAWKADTVKGVRASDGRRFNIFLEMNAGNYSTDVQTWLQCMQREITSKSMVQLNFIRI